MFLFAYKDHEIRMLRDALEKERTQSIALSDRLQDELTKQLEGQKGRASNEQVYEINMVFLISLRNLVLSIIYLSAKRKRDF